MCYEAGRGEFLDGEKEVQVLMGGIVASAFVWAGESIGSEEIVGRSRVDGSRHMGAE